MYLHLNGNGPPESAPNFLGQHYLDTSQTPPAVYIAASMAAWRCVDDSATGAGAPSVAPSRDGQLYLDTESNALYVASGLLWVNVAGGGRAAGLACEISDAAPDRLPEITGELWFVRTTDAETLYQGMVYPTGDYEWGTPQYPYTISSEGPTAAPENIPSYHIQDNGLDGFITHFYQTDAWLEVQSATQTNDMTPPTGPAQFQYDGESVMYESALVESRVWMITSTTKFTPP